MKPFMEALPPEVDTKLKRVKPPEEQVLFQVATDLINDQLFGEKMAGCHRSALAVYTD